MEEDQSEAEGESEEKTACDSANASCESEASVANTGIGILGKFLHMVRKYRLGRAMEGAIRTGPVKHTKEGTKTHQEVLKKNTKKATSPKPAGIKSRGIKALKGVGRAGKANSVVGTFLGLLNEIGMSKRAVENNRDFFEQQEVEWDREAEANGGKIQILPGVSVDHPVMY